MFHNIAESTCVMMGKLATFGSSITRHRAALNGVALAALVSKLHILQEGTQFLT